jgi:hypothetical protein
MRAAPSTTCVTILMSLDLNVSNSARNRGELLLQRQRDQDAGDDCAEFDEEFAPRFRGVRFVQIQYVPPG